MNKIVLVFGVEALRPEAIAVMDYTIDIKNGKK